MLLKLRKLRWYITGRFRIRKAISRASRKGRIRLILGASITGYDGWISTDLPHFNILKDADWKFFFTKHKPDNLLAEHVFEHLTVKQVITALQLCYQWLRPGGRLRIAVPDAYHPSPEYLAATLPPADNHFSSWSIDSLSRVLKETGFKVEPLEYYSTSKELIQNPYDSADGYVRRSVTVVFDPRIPGYSSLIVDAVKPTEKA